MMCMVGEHQCTGADIEKEDCTAAGQTRDDMESRGEGAVRFRPDTQSRGGGGGGAA